MNEADDAKMRRLHEETRELVAKAAAAPFGCGLDIVKQSGYWDEANGPQPDDEEADGKDWWAVTVDASVAATATLHVRAGDAEEAKKLARAEARDLGAFDFDHEEICDVQIRGVEKGAAP